MEKDITGYTPSGNVELFTPSKFIEAARQVMGGRIHLDPASTVVANSVVKADFFFTKDDDGLSLPWDVMSNSRTTVFCNPPYGRRYGDKGPHNVTVWTDKVIEEFRANRIRECILLLNSGTASRWFHKIMDLGFPACFVKPRIRFIDATTMEPQTKPRWDSVFFYLGGKPLSFRMEFSQFGTIVQRM